jgi:hypothetical protein
VSSEPSKHNHGLDNRLIAGTPATDKASRVRRRPLAGRAAQFLCAGGLMGSAEFWNITRSSLRRQ